MFFFCLFIKVAKIVPLCWTKWLPELKTDKRLLSCLCFTQCFSFRVGDSHGLSLLVCHKFPTLKFCHGNQKKTMATFYLHLSSHDTITSTSYLEFRWAIQALLLKFKVATAWQTNDIVPGHKTHKLGKISSNDQNCQIWFHHFTVYGENAIAPFFHYKSKGAFCCHGKQIKRQTGKF